MNIFLICLYALLCLAASRAPEIERRKGGKVSLLLNPIFAHGALLRRHYLRWVLAMVWLGVPILLLAASTQLAPFKEEELRTGVTIFLMLINAAGALALLEFNNRLRKQKEPGLDQAPESLILRGHDQVVIHGDPQLINELYRRNELLPHLRRTPFEHCVTLPATAFLRTGSIPNGLVRIPWMGNLTQTIFGKIQELEMQIESKVSRLLELETDLEKASQTNARLIAQIQRLETERHEIAQKLSKARISRSAREPDYNLLDAAALENEKELLSRKLAQVDAVLRQKPISPQDSFLEPATPVSHQEVSGVAGPPSPIRPDP